MINKTDMNNCLSSYDLIMDDVKYKGGHYKEDELHFNRSRRYLREWDEGAFIGNGMTGAMIYKESKRRMRFELGRNDVVAHNFLEGIDWGTPRVPIGDLVLETEGEIDKETMRIHLYDAYVSSEIYLENETISWSCFNHATKDVFVICIDNDDLIDFSFRPKHGISPRINYANKNPDMQSIPYEPQVSYKKGVMQSIMRFLKENKDEFIEEGVCSVCILETKENDKTIIYVSCENSYYDESAIEKAYLSVVEASKIGYDELFKEHKKVWHDYYGLSKVTIDDEYWQKFYWIQMYKQRCAIRENGVVCDSQGPWLTVTPWPTTVWNLNVQLTYMSLYTSNRYKLANSLVNTLKKNKQNLIDNAKPMGINNGMYLSRQTNTVDLTYPWPDTRELGNLTWALHNVYRQYEVSMDKELALDIIFPYLKMNMHSYFTLLEKDEDEKYHLKDTSSPEYPSKKGHNHYPVTDCNYSLALMRWGLSTLIELDEVYDLKDEEKSFWEEILLNIAPYPIDENGFMIAKDVPFAVSHRHYSHLFMIYPLFELDPLIEKDKEIMLKSIEHWVGFKGALQGYTYTGASAMMAYMKDGNRALEYLNGLKQYVTPNTMYSESGPVIETPLSASESIHQMLLQCHRGRIMLFPAMPDEWKSASFENLVVRGGYSISAKYENGKIIFAKITSKRKGTVKIDVGDIVKPQDVEASKEDRCYILNMNENETVTFLSS